MRTTSAAGSTIGLAPPLGASGAADTHLSAIFVPPPISNRPTFAHGLHADGRLGRFGQLTLQSDAAARRIQHLEQSLVEGPRPLVGSALSDGVSEGARTGF